MSSLTSVDAFSWRPVAFLQKWDDDATEWLHSRLGRTPLRDDFLAAKIEPWGTATSVGNALLNAGITRLLNLLVAAGSTQAYTNTYTRIGVGDGTTAVAASDTDLSAVAGSTHRWFRAADSTYPSISAQTLTCVATFPTGDGNFAWNEWGIDQGGAGSSTSSNAVSAPLLNRKVPATSLGTKTSGSWALTVTITIA